MDTATGLIYVGNGQYYDPQTGRFLNRNVNPNSTNSYVPWGGNPTGALVAPLFLLAMIYSRKKKRGKIDMFIILLVLCLGVSVSLVACGPDGTQPPPTATAQIVTMAPSAPNYAATATVTANGIPVASGVPTVTPTPCPTITMTFTRTPTPEPINCGLFDDSRDRDTCTTYLVLQAHPDGWWNEGGGSFDVMEYLSAAFAFEYEDALEGGIEEEVLEEMTVRNYYYWCPAYNACNNFDTSETGFHNVITYMGRKGLVIYYDAKTHLPLRDRRLTFQSTQAEIDALWNAGEVPQRKDFSDAFKAPHGDWNTPASYNRPMDWANATVISNPLFPKVSEGDRTIEISYYDDIYRRTGDPNARPPNLDFFFLETLCQKTYWDDGVQNPYPGICIKNPAS